MHNYVCVQCTNIYITGIHGVHKEFLILKVLVFKVLLKVYLRRYTNTHHYIFILIVAFLLHELIIVLAFIKTTCLYTILQYVNILAKIYCSEVNQALTLNNCYFAGSRLNVFTRKNIH